MSAEQSLLTLDILRGQTTDTFKAYQVHQEGVQLAGVALPWRVQGRTAARRCRPWGIHQGRGWEATRPLA